MIQQECIGSAEESHKNYSQLPVIVSKVSSIEDLAKLNKLQTSLRSESLQDDTYLFSPLYYFLTGRTGCWMLESGDSCVLVCRHPHVLEHLLIFPELGVETNYHLTLTALRWSNVPPECIFLARYRYDDLLKLGSRLASDAYWSAWKVLPEEENYLDWRYPVHIIDTKIVSDVEGRWFIKVRNKLRKIPSSMMFFRLAPSRHIEMMRLVLWQWQTYVKSCQKCCQDVTDYYEKLFSVAIEKPTYIDGLLFTSSGRPVGFTLWGLSGEDTADLFANLADSSVAGLSDYQIVETCRYLTASGIRYLNLGGSEEVGLDKFKRKFLPVCSLNLHTARLIR